MPIMAFLSTWFDKLDKPSKRLMREWVKCEVCGHEWEKLRKNEG